MLEQVTWMGWTPTLLQIVRRRGHRRALHARADRHGDHVLLKSIVMYTLDTTELTDPALVRRMKREQGNADSKENLRVFGPPKGYAYANNRIELQR